MNERIKIFPNLLGLLLPGRQGNRLINSLIQTVIKQVKWLIATLDRSNHQEKAESKLHIFVTIWTIHILQTVNSKY